MSFTRSTSSLSNLTFNDLNIISTIYDFDVLRWILILNPFLFAKNFSFATDNEFNHLYNNFYASPSSKSSEVRLYAGYI